MLVRRALFAGMAAMVASLSAAVAAHLWPRRVAAREFDAGPVGDFVLGDVVFGPAPRPLDALPVRILNGRVLVTAREGAERPRQRGEPAQVAHS